MPGGANRYRKFLPNGQPNPRYRVRSGRKSKGDRAEFIAVDGEGYSVRSWSEPFRKSLPPYGNWSSPFDPADADRYAWCADRDDGLAFKATTEVTDQAYVMLATSAGGYRYDRGGLSTEDCLSLLIEQTIAHPQAIFIGYGFNYDAEMILADLPRVHLRRLHRGAPVSWHGYGLRYHRRKLLWIQDRSWSRTRTSYTPSLIVYDAFSFFNSAFVITVEEWLGADYPDLELLRQGKALRSQFGDLDDEAFIRRYNDAENRALVEVMNKLHAAMTEAGVRPRAWYGPGAVAAEYLRHHEVGDHLARTAVNRSEGSRATGRRTSVATLESVPRHVREAALCAFAAGRIEAVMVGNYEEPLWKYDLNSAYPSAMPDLPSLREGRWICHDGRPGRDDIIVYGLYRVRWDLPDGAPFYPFPWRAKDGSIFFPPTGANWAWGPEVLAAMEAGMCRPTDIEAWIEFCQASDAKPLAWVVELAEHRLAAKSAGLPAHYPMKLGLNSLYGKLAQQRGFQLGHDGKTTRVPTYYQPEWSGFITSDCRAKVFRAAMQAPQAVTGFQTDGLVTLEPLHLDIGPGLGQWEAVALDWFTQCQSGVYWFQVSGEAEPEQHYRGFDPPGREGVRRPLSRERVLAAYRHGDPVLECEMERLVSLGQALQHPGNEAAFRHYWRKWRRAPRFLSLAMQTGKRATLRPAQLRRAAHQLVATAPRDLRLLQATEQPFSTPYRVLWSDWQSSLAELAEVDERYDGTTWSAVEREL